MALSPEQKLAYIENPTICPYCKRDDIEVAVSKENGGWFSNIVKCQWADCGKQWMEVFRLVGIEETEGEGPPPDQLIAEIPKPKLILP